MTRHESTYFSSYMDIDPQSDITIEYKALKETYRPHFHDYIEIELITDGVARQTINDNVSHLKPGCLSVLRLTDKHQIIPDGITKLTHFNINQRMISNEILRRLSLISVPSVQLNDDDYKIISTLCDICHDELQKKFVNKEYIKKLVDAILVKFLELMIDDGHFQKIEHISSASIKEALYYIHQNFRENISLEQVAQTFHYNPCHFSATFHKETGLEFIKYVTKLRINYAKKLLADEGPKIRNVYREAGFKTYEGFLKAFKKTTGMSPSEYKASRNSNH